MPISININVSKLDKRKFVDGKKGVYANITLWETEKGSESSEYGDYIVKQTGEKGDKMPILGNGKFYEPKSRGRSGRRDDRRDRRRDDDRRDYDQRRHEPDEDEVPF